MTSSSVDLVARLRMRGAEEDKTEQDAIVARVNARMKDVNVMLIIEVGQDYD